MHVEEQDEELARTRTGRQSFGSSLSLSWKVVVTWKAFVAEKNLMMIVLSMYAFNCASPRRLAESPHLLFPLPSPTPLFPPYSSSSSPPTPLLLLSSPYSSSSSSSPPPSASPFRNSYYLSGGPGRKGVGISEVRVFKTTSKPQNRGGGICSEGLSQPIENCPNASRRGREQMAGGGREWREGGEEEGRSEEKVLMPVSVQEEEG
eukprot:768208-Hanusia_phi.AAC.5